VIGRAKWIGGAALRATAGNGDDVPAATDVGDDAPVGNDERQGERA
jgi:hypothetical protein